MPSFSSLPTETLLAILDQLDDDRAALQSLCLVNKALAGAITPLIWRKLTLHYSKLKCRKSLDRCSSLCSQQFGASLQHVRVLKISTPCLKYQQEGADERAAAFDELLSRLLAGLPMLQDLYVDLCMSLYALPKTTQAILRYSKPLKSLNMRNVYAYELPLTTVMPNLQNLSIGYSGSRLKLDLSCFSNLRSLALSLEVHDAGSEREDDSVRTDSQTILRIPTALWSNLRTLKLDIFPWVPIDVLIQDFEQSFKGAQASTTLEDLAIFWNIPECAQLHLLRLFAHHCPNIHRLALTTWEIPTTAYINRLSSIFSLHKIVQLTLCAYMPCGSWQWPDSASAYGSAFASFPYLRQLAINHNEDIESYEVDEGLTGKFTYDCLEKGAELRIAFAEEIQKKCSALSEIAFCPLEQEKSRLQVRPTRDPNGPPREARFVNEGCRFFWHYI